MVEDSGHRAARRRERSRLGKGSLRRGVVVVFTLVGLTLGVMAPSRAESVRAHATVGVAHAVSAPQSREFGWGAAGSVALELPLSRAFGVEGKLGGVVLGDGKPPSDPSLAPKSFGLAVLLTAGVRVRPFTAVAGPWASLGAGVAQSGTRTRPTIDGALGWDFRVHQSHPWDIGPFVQYMQIVQPDDALAPNDARLLSAGIQVGLGAAKPVVARPDRDDDFVYDDEDACPDVKGLRTRDPLTNGCPPDRDHDTVVDDEDACPDVAGPRTDDPKTNGCPPPRVDRDHDGIYDDEDACPDLPGITTGDPKTNGCPPATASVHIEKDRILLDSVILFDTDSPRVRHASWGIVQKLADFIRATPDLLEVSIEGHADATGEDDHNMVLSRDRAESVRRLLIRDGVAADRLKAEAFGRSRLKVQTDKAEVQNRRVEFWITRVREVTETSPQSGATGGGEP